MVAAGEPPLYGADYLTTAVDGAEKELPERFHQRAFVKQADGSRVEKTMVFMYHRDLVFPDCPVFHSFPTWNFYGQFTDKMWANVVNQTPLYNLNRVSKVLL
jgi:hypothetical protein